MGGFPQRKSFRSSVKQWTPSDRKPTAGDIRCTALGHITRMAIWQLRPSWDGRLPTAKKLSVFRKAMDALATVEDVKIRLEGTRAQEPALVGGLFAQEETRDLADAVAF